SALFIAASGVLAIWGMAFANDAQSSGYFDIPGNYELFITRYALTLAGFIAFQIIVHLIILAFNPFSPINDFFCDLRDFFIDQVLPRLHGHKVTKRTESALDEVNISGEDRRDYLVSKFLIKHARYIERNVLQANDLFLEHPDGFHGIGTTIEQKPGDEGIQRMDVLNNNPGHINPGQPMNCVGILFTHHGYQFINDILINSKPPAICIEKTFIL
ncbi:MAG: hypothetical protein LBK61_04880, partial [Spirochaetaceae bacterium]|nr:hypothetical protein [Spirochaetaceae bacterium]